MSMDKSTFPVLHQSLKTLSCCVGFGGLMRNSTFGVLGTIQIMVGLFNVGLGPGRTSTRPGDLTSLGAPYWLGAVCIAAGILSVIVGQFPCVCFTWYAVFMNVAGCIFAITGIVLYAVDVAEASVVWMCDLNWPTAQYDDNCRYVALFAQSLLTAMDVTLIVLTVLQLCVCISAAVLGIRALCSRMKAECAIAPVMKITKSSSTVTEASVSQWEVIVKVLQQHEWDLDVTCVLLCRRDSMLNLSASKNQNQPAGDLQNLEGNLTRESLLKRLMVCLGEEAENVTKEYLGSCPEGGS